MPLSKRRVPKKRRRSGKRLTGLELESLFDGAVNKSYRTRAPKFLYHYTTWLGGAGIIRTQKIWATAHDCTNDKAEVISADRVILEVADELRAVSRGAGRRALDVFIRDYQASHVARKVPIYIASFSASRDDDHQWHRYGEERRGLCLALRVLDEQAPDNPALGCAMLHVQYSEDEWKDDLRENLGLISKSLSRPEVPRTASNVRLGVGALNRVAAFASISAKQLDWSPEQEIRQVALGKFGKTVDVKHRPRGTEDVRYVELLLRQPPALIAFSEIIIGPGCTDPNAENKVAELLKEAGYVAGMVEFPMVSRSILTS